MEARQRPLQRSDFEWLESTGVLPIVKFSMGGKIVFVCYSYFGQAQQMLKKGFVMRLFQCHFKVRAFLGERMIFFLITNIHSWKRSRIPARLRTASVPRKAEKSVEFSSPEIDHELKRTRKKWKSFNCSTPINNNNVDLLREWREELAEEQNIASLIQLSKDLLAFEGHNLGFDEIAYR